MDLIRQGGEANQWNIDLRQTARIWKAGCIIRARFLDTIMKAYETDEALPNLMLDETIRKELELRVPALRTAVALAAQAGVPALAMNASLAYFDSIRTARLPQNLTQAQRDAFGAHTYQTVSDPSGPAVHSEWLES